MNMLLTTLFSCFNGSCTFQFRASEAFYRTNALTPAKGGQIRVWANPVHYHLFLLTNAGQHYQQTRQLRRRKSVPVSTCRLSRVPFALLPILVARPNQSVEAGRPQSIGIFWQS